MVRTIIKDSVVTHLRLVNTPVYARTYKGLFTKADVAKRVDDLVNKYKDKNLRFMVSVDTSFGFRSGPDFNPKEAFKTAKSFNVAKLPILVEDYEWETTDQFIIYVWKDNDNAGGDDDLHNDCLIDCIKEVIHIFRFPKDCKTAEIIKWKIGLKRDDKIPVDSKYIGAIEGMLKVNINITGDYVFSSKGTHQMTCHLILKDGHYSVDKGNQNNTQLLHGVHKFEQKLVMCYVDTENKNVLCYDGDKSFTIEFHTYYEARKEYFGKYSYQETKKPDVIKQYKEFMYEVKKLATYSGGKFDLSRSGYNFANEARKTLHYSLRGFESPEQITQQEKEWISNAFKGGLIFSNKGCLPDAYNYDENSQYAAAMSNTTFTFPVKQGKFEFIDCIPEKFFKYGIYRVEVLQSNDPHINKLFRFNQLNYYTHYDLTSARKLGLEMRLIIDEQANVLLYSKGRADGYKYFYQCVDELYSLKRSDCKLAKNIIVALWGSLCSRNKYTRINTKEINLKEDDELLSVNPFGDNLHKIVYAKKDRYFRFNYARMGVFLTSFVRHNMASIIFPHKENVFRCHTDSILSNIPLSLLDIGGEMGKFKLEKHGEANIQNSMKVEWALILDSSEAIEKYQKKGFIQREDGKWIKMK